MHKKPRHGIFSATPSEILADEFERFLIPPSCVLWAVGLIFHHFSGTNGSSGHIPHFLQWNSILDLIFRTSRVDEDDESQTVQGILLNCCGRISWSAQRVYWEQRDWLICRGFVSLIAFEQLVYQLSFVCLFQKIWYLYKALWLRCSLWKCFPYVKYSFQFHSCWTRLTDGKETFLIVMFKKFFTDVVFLRMC